ncbi:hypothetical protein [Hymenobacter lucidus]|uniref:Uncharacterized protein n=1 Tax=Hymenobacter lucidus TaxID=2880930 RepID=A0ABS8AR11_9BACT|nr:hypothetical protein [Hymenobacter lucidus]MCB2408655.1 hypothetical protein [Hymenobacter lucidus]
MKTSGLLYGLMLLGLLQAHGSRAQAIKPDSSFLALASAKMASLQLEDPDNSSHLYNGAEYVHYERMYTHVEGHQFFQTTELQPGDIYYDGALYHNIPLLYDIKLDQVVLKFPKSPLQLKLVNEKLMSFTVNQHTFVRLVGDNTAKAAVPTGFYDVRLEGKTRVLARRIKKANETITTTGVELSFDEADKFYVEKGGVVYPISGKGAFVAVLEDKKKELRKYISTQKLKFTKEQQEASFIKLAQYYNTL